MYLTGKKNMSRSIFTHFLLLSFAACFSASGSSLSEAAAQSHRAAGVFMFIEGGQYTLNFLAARAACLSLNASMATMAQMERALQDGLETCKFGWIAEQIAVVPRLKPDKNCGKSKTGVVTWAASADRKFGVFCFNASDLEETLIRSTASPQSSTFSATLTARSQTSTPATPLHRSTTKPPPSRRPRTTNSPEQTSFSTASTLPVETTHSTRIPSITTTLKSFSTHVPTSLPHLVTSKPSTKDFAFSTSAHAAKISVSSEPAPPPLMSPKKSSLGDVPTALTIISIILVLLTAAGVVWYYKLNVFTFWPQGQQKDDVETEMWKHEDSEMGSQHEEEEEEELDRKYSSDITLCVNPDMRTNSSE